MGLKVCDNVFCTLFDSNYLDKGLVMLQSLRRHCNSRIYVLAMDEKCSEILTKENIEDLCLITLDEFLDDELRRCRDNNSHGIFCWSCTAALVCYIFDRYHEKIATYIDADLFFYTNPDILLMELINSGKSVQIIRHNFKKGLDSYLQEKISGTYCVQFNSFINNEYARTILNEWKEQTLGNCSIESRVGYGDQQYLDAWPIKYQNHVNILENMGAGIAPWNFERYSAIPGDLTKVCLDGQYIVPIVFYHFHNVINIDRKQVNIHIYERSLCVDSVLIKYIYIPYLKRINAMKRYLSKNYGFYPLITAYQVMRKDQKSPLVKLQDINELYYVLTIWIRLKRKLIRAIAWKRNIISI